MQPCTENIFDVVNENDEVMYQKPRDEVHAQELLHRASHIWVTDVEGRILLQRRSLNKDTYPNCWTSSVSGHVDAGENYEQSAHREIIEEIGWNHPVQLQLIAYEKACPQTEFEFVKLYHMSADGPFHFPPEEVSELSWKTPQQVHQMIHEIPTTFAPFFIYLWQRNYKALLALLTQ